MRCGSVRLIAAALPFVLLLAAGQGAFGQSQAPPAAGPEGETATAQAAIVLLDSALEDLRDIEDLPARIELTGQIVRVLLAHKPARCREALDRLFDEALKRKSVETADGKERQAEVDAGLRRIISLAAQVDRKLAQSYMERYAQAWASGAETTAMAPMAAGLHMRLALELVEKDAALAVAAAERSLAAPIDNQTLVFLALLRKKDVSLANRFFVAALKSVERREGYDLNELLTLFAYVFSPARVPVVAPQGLAVMQVPGYAAADYPVDAQLARAFLSSAVRLLMQPARYAANNVERLSAGVIGDFYFLKLIEPQVAAYLPARAPQLAEIQTLIAGLVHPDQQSTAQANLDKWHAPPASSPASPGRAASAIESLLQRAERAATPAQKDLLYYNAATQAAKEKRFDEALRIVDLLSDAARQQAGDLIRFSIAERAAKDGDLERAEYLARRGGDLPQRAYLLTAIADALAAEKTDTVRAAALLTEVEQLAGQLPFGRERVAVLAGAAAALSRFDTLRGFELLRAAVQVANKVETFNGDTRLTRSITFNDFGFFYEMYGDRFTLREAVQRLGAENFQMAALDVTALKDRRARLQAIVMLCGAALANRPRAEG